MNTPVRCDACKKPIILSEMVIKDDDDGREYVLCPWSNCQTMLYLPLKFSGVSNPELHEHVRHTLRDPETGRFVSGRD